MGVDAASEGDTGSPGPGGASPYLRRGFAEPARYKLALMGLSPPGPLGQKFPDVTLCKMSKLLRPDFLPRSASTDILRTGDEDHVVIVARQARSEVCRLNGRVNNAL
jgi:hypothetical protein